MKQWLVLSLKASSDTAEAICNYLFEIGSTGVQDKDGVIEAYFSDAFDANELKAQVEKYLASLQELGGTVFPDSLSISTLDDRDWNAEWKQSYHSIRITDNILIKPSWEQAPPDTDAVVIEIDPEMAFGTGTHESTRLVLKLLEKNIRPNAAVLDVGTGTGILAIASLKLGARRVYAFDIDPLAVETAKKNALKNKVGNNLLLYAGTIDSIGQRVFDIILANVNRIEIDKMLNHFYRLASDKSKIIISGILAEEDELLRTRIKETNLTIESILSEGEWLAYLLARKEN